MAFAQVPEWQPFDPIGRRKYVNAPERLAYLEVTNRLQPLLRAYCRTLAFTGCRVSEGLSLTRHQLDLAHFTVTIRTLKRRKLAFRLVQIPEELALELSALPVLEDGRFWTMHRTTAWRLIKRVMIEAGVAGPMACGRGLRHGFGVRAVVFNVPIPTLAKWMGHADTKTTSIYTDVVGAEERSFAARMW